MAIQLRKYINKKGKDVPFLYIEQDGTFYVRKRIGDSTPRKSLETKIESIAILKLHDAIKEMENLAATKKAKAEGKEDPVPSKPKLVRDFYEDLITEKKAQEVKASTLRRINTVWTHNIEPFWGNLFPNEIDKAKVLDFMVWHRKAKPKVQFQNTFKYLGNLFRIMVEAGAMKLENVPNLELPLPEQKHHKAKKGRIIAVDEFREIISFLPSFRLLFELAFATGMRQMEIGSLRHNQVVKRGNEHYFDFSWQDTKTGITRFVPIPPFLISRILELKSNGSPYLFPAPTDLEKHVSAKVIHTIWTAAKAKAEISGKMRFHDIRHTVATNLVKANFNPLLIATYLGMTIKTLQEKYLKLAPEDLLVINRSVLDLSNSDQNPDQPEDKP